MFFRMEARPERPNTIAGLIDKRAELAALLKFHRAELRKIICDLDHVDATIRLFDPDADTSRVKRYPTKHRAQKGEMIRFVLVALKRASSPLTSLEITQAQIKTRGLKADDQTTVLMRKRVGACLTAMKAKGLARSVTTDGPYKGWELVR
ncbi:hypothetical protein [Phenylobacterium sp.]|jgi:hypothetical protein|uniref:hypothetical protein n=1 Tax=Phenylobacterium sp. TaxID=1871053 RepID=UPI002F424FC9